MSKIKIESVVPYTISFYFPEYRVNHMFTPQSKTYFIEEETLSELIFNDGIKQLFDDGVLIIEDKKDRIKVNLGSDNEEEDKIIKPKVYLDSDLIKLLKDESFDKFKAEIENYPLVQLNRIVDLAVKNKLTDYNKVQLLKEKTGKDINKIISIQSED